MIESIYAEAFIKSVLLGDATLTGASCLNGSYVYKNRAPQKTPLPLIIYNVQSPGDVNSGNGTRIFARPLFQVRTVGKVINADLQAPERVRATANRMDALLSAIRRQSLTVDSVTFFYNVWREDERVEEEAGETAEVSYRNYGGYYRVEVFS